MTAAILYFLLSLQQVVEVAAHTAEKSVETEVLEAAVVFLTLPLSPLPGVQGQAGRGITAD